MFPVHLWSEVASVRRVPHFGLSKRLVKYIKYKNVAFLLNWSSSTTYTEYSSNSHGIFCCLESPPPSPNHILLSRQFAYTRTYDTCEYVPLGMAPVINELEVVVVGFEFRAAR